MRLSHPFFTFFTFVLTTVIAISFNKFKPSIVRRQLAGNESASTSTLESLQSQTTTLLSAHGFQASSLSTTVSKSSSLDSDWLSSSSSRDSVTSALSVGTLSVSLSASSIPLESITSGVVDISSSAGQSLSVIASTEIPSETTIIIPESSSMEIPTSTSIPPSNSSSKKAKTTGDNKNGKDIPTSTTFLIVHATGTSGQSGALNSAADGWRYGPSFGHSLQVVIVFGMIGMMYQ